MPKVIKAIYTNGVFKPLEKLNLKEGIMLELEIKESVTGKTKGIISKDSIDDIIEEIEGGGFL